MMIAVTDQPDMGVPKMGSVKRRERFLTVFVAVLATALLGLGAWAFLDDGSSGAAPPADVEQVIAIYEEARNTLNPELLESIITDDFAAPYAMYSVGASQVWETGEGTRTDVLHEVTNAEGWVAWEVTQVGEATSVGDGPWHVSVPTLWTIAGGGWEGITTYTIVDDGGQLLLSEASWVGTAVPADQ